MMIFQILVRLKDKRMFVRLIDVPNVTFIKVNYYSKHGYIDVGDRCWRRNVLVTILRYW